MGFIFVDKRPENERDELWDLLGKAKPTMVSPFFARNILRKIHESAPARVGIFRRLITNWRLGLATSMALLVFVSAGRQWLPSRHASSGMIAAASEIADDTDYEVIDHLDEMLASEEESVWLEKSVY